MYVFAFKGFVLHDTYKKQEVSLSNSGYKTKKKCGGKNVLKHAHLWRGSTQIKC